MAKAADENFLNAKRINVNEETFGSFNKNTNGKDCYEFSLSEDGVVQISFDHEYVDYDPCCVMGLYTSADKMIANYSWRGTALSSEKSWRIGLSASTYYLKFSHCSSRGDGRTCYYSYRFTVIYSSSDSWEKEENDLIIYANEILTGSWFHGSFIKDYDDDWYKFHATQSGQITVSVKAEGTIPRDGILWYALCDADNNNIFDSAYYFQNSSSNINKSIPVSEGDYYLRLNNRDAYYDYSFSVDYINAENVNVVKDEKSKEGKTDNITELITEETEYVVGKLKYRKVDKDEVSVIGIDSEVDVITVPAPQKEQVLSGDDRSEPDRKGRLLRRIKKVLCNIFMP